MNYWRLLRRVIHRYYWYWIDLVNNTRLLSIQYPYRFGITTWKPITRHNSWNRNQICFITDESFHDFVHSVVCPLHDEVILLYYDMTTRGSTLNELLAAIAARHSPVLSGGELSIILPSGQSNGECRYWLLRSGDIQILFCGARNPRGTLLCMYETHIIRTRRHLDR